MGLMLLIGMVVFGAVFVSLATVFAVLLRLLLWTVFLPFRLIVGVIALPLLIVKFVVLAVLGVVAFSVIGIVGGALVAGLLAAAVTSLLPLALVVLAVWGISRLLRRPITA